MPRQICPTCQRPLKVCYCSALVHCNRIKVLIIQHPLEQKHPFNTGRMAHLCLSNSELVVAERLPEAESARLLVLASATATLATDVNTGGCSPTPRLYNKLCRAILSSSG